MVAIAAALAACGGEDTKDRSAGSNKDQIAFAITESFTSNDPEKCTAFHTQRFLEVSMGAPGARAIRACEALAGIANAESTKVSAVTVRRNTASAEVAMKGGQLDGQTVEFEVVKQHGQWKVDRLTAFISFDRKALNAAFAEVLREFGLPPDFAECPVSKFTDLSDEKARASFMSPETGNEIGRACARELQ